MIDLSWEEGRELRDLIFGRSAPVQNAPESDPPGCAALAALQGLPFGLAPRFVRALPAGIYALAISAGPEGPGCLVCARIEAGAVARLVGGSALGLGRGLPEPEKWLAAAGRLGPLRLGLEAPRFALRAILDSTRPVSALERARIRNALRVSRLSPRVAGWLFVLRLFGR